jgi:hypothetical protein
MKKGCVPFCFAPNLAWHTRLAGAVSLSILMSVSEAAPFEKQLELSLRMGWHDFWAKPITLHLFKKQVDQKNWPLKVDFAWVGCREDAKDVSEIIFLASPTGEDQAWPINGTTRSWVKRLGYTLYFDGVSYEVQSNEPEEWWWWADNPAYDPTDLFSGPKVDITPLFDFLTTIGC